MTSLSTARKNVESMLGHYQTEAIETFVVCLIQDQIAQANQSLLIFERIAALERERSDAGQPERPDDTKDGK